MSEAAFIAFNKAFSVAAEVLYAGCLTWYLRSFLPKRRMQLAVFASYLLLRLLWDGAAIPKGVFGLLLIALPTAAAGALGLARGMAFLLALLHWNARTSSGLMIESLYHLLDRCLPPPANVPEAVYLRAAALLSVFLLSHAAVLAAMLCALRRRLLKRPMALHRRELCYLSLVPAAGILFGQVISRLLIEFQDGVPLQLYVRHPAFLAVVPVLALLFYAGAYLTIAFQQGMAALREEQAALYAEYQQAQAIRARIHEAEQFYTRIRSLKHEMRGHMANVKALAARGEYAGLADYIARMDESIGDFASTLQTGNPVTDVIVGDFQRRSLDLGIPLQVDFRYPDPAGYDAFDAGIILQNLLQNAVEASEKVPEDARSITLTGKRKGRFFLIEVQNAFTGQVTFGPDGLPATTKTEDASLHGLGLANVRRAAEKYMGELELKAERQVFSATVLLQERSKP